MIFCAVRFGQILLVVPLGSPITCLGTYSCTVWYVHVVGSKEDVKVIKKFSGLPMHS